ncbi:synaptobrevin domain-containing protein [Gigaspora margarita]|nr:synaptobrevin domain-containing protein [Gigaspora margarita]
MSLIYGLVARGSVILAEHTNSSGNFTQVTQAILEKIPPNNSKSTYVCDRYLFHYICEDGLTYMCMADDSFGRRIPFAFLQDIKERFLTNYSRERINEAPTYDLNEFSKIISKQMEYFSSNPEAGTLKKVHGEIDQVKDIMVHNVERILERGERIELLVDKTDNPNQRSTALRVLASLNFCFIIYPSTKQLIELKTAINVVEKYQIIATYRICYLIHRVLYYFIVLWLS